MGLLLRGRIDGRDDLSGRQEDNAPVDATNNLAQPTNNNSNNNSGPLVDPWVIVVIVIGTLLVVSLVSAIAILYSRSRRRKQEVKHADPISHEYSRRRKMNQADRLEADEMERAIMIRKSLASRTSNRHSQNSSMMMMPPDLRLMEISDDAAEKASLREDWNDREAGVQIEREKDKDKYKENPRTPDSEPPHGQYQPHPMFFPPRLPVPTASRSPSPVRSVLPPRKNTPPPQFFFTQL
ncbi:hypothetical protein F4775DRAFT_252394 [Biscogniauxia sp. FL1348]|nr:hypothetical protein F4775DRAFT_252394 [Biscogniauxia sp. FL1348]